MSTIGTIIDTFSIIVLAAALILNVYVLTMQRWSISHLKARVQILEVITGIAAVQAIVREQSAEVAKKMERLAREAVADGVRMAECTEDTELGPLERLSRWRQ